MIAHRSPGAVAGALALSAAVHAFVATDTFIALPQPPEDGAPLPLAARLAPAASTASTTSTASTASTVSTPSALRPATPARTAQARPARAPQPGPPLAPPAAAPEDVPAGVVAAREDGAEPDLEVADAAPAEDVRQAGLPPPAPVAARAAEDDPASAPLRALPRRGSISYTLFFGTERFAVGRTIQTWEAEGGAYRIGSQSETSGLASVFRNERRTYLSEGEITARGLQPKSFLMSRLRRGQTEVARARFDWDAGSITWGTAHDRHEAALPAGSQDFLSLLFQLALAPPAAGRVTLPITTGTRFETLELEVLPEETLDTPLGALRTLPLRQVGRPGTETMQVWLAADYRHLPVQLRFFGRDGAPTGEQVVSEIRLAEQ